MENLAHFLHISSFAEYSNLVWRRAMKAKASFLYSICILVTAVSAQGPDVLWTYTAGTCAAGYEIIETSDSCYCIVGFWGNPPDVCLFKLDPNGTALVRKMYGGAFADEGWSVTETFDKGYAIIGQTRSTGGGNWDMWLIKTDPYGHTMWTRTYGGAGDEKARSIQQTSDSGFIFVGRTSSFGAGEDDIYLVRTDQYGNTLWTRAYGGEETDYGMSVQQTADEGYIIVGTTLSFGAGSGDIYLIRTDSLGDSLWTRTYGGAGSEAGYSVQQISNRGYIITGRTASFSSFGIDAYVIRTDGLGDTIWTRHWGDNNYDMGKCVILAAENTFVIAGVTVLPHNNFANILLMKTNLTGDMLWTKDYGQGAIEEWGSSVCMAFDGSYVIAGEKWCGNGIYVVKTEPDTKDKVNDVAVEEEDSGAPFDYLGATIFSGPLRLPEGKICRVFDITGRVVAPDKIRSGIYFIEVEGKITQKVVKVR
jgi:hypothetical protein